MVEARELRLGLDIVKHTIQKALQVDNALDVETHFFIVEFAIEHEICKQYLLDL
jgi:phage-related baseplate assembly protein